jgi:hypothetical protein
VIHEDLQETALLGRRLCRESLANVAGFFDGADGAFETLRRGTQFTDAPLVLGLFLPPEGCFFIVERYRDQRLAYSDVMPGDPERSDGIPQWILDWQYGEGLLMRAVPSDSAAQAWTDTKVAEQHCECARRLAFFVVAKQAGASVEYLRKVCRKYDCAASEFEPNEECED